ncbi:MAG: ATP-dependent helicase, partial [Actinomycetota bacterium]|nr:ATP-dependent helicase [Actinomycetota bacterium]
EPAGTTEELMARIPEAWVEDLRTLSWAFYASQEQLIHESREVCIGPMFEGSRDVGGADADLILDGCLLEIKATTNPKIASDMLYQLLGYAMLDYADEYEIRSAAVYMARQSRLVEWDIQELLSSLGCEDDLPELRRSFSETMRASA